MSRPATILTLLFTLAATRALASDKGFAVVAESEHFSFFAYVENGKHLKVDPKRNEVALREIAGRLGVEPPERITYYRHEYPEEVAFNAGEPSLWATGVAQPATMTIHSVMPAHPHEIVHLVASRLGDPGRFFQEGLAVALGDRGRLWGQSVDRLARASLERVSLMNAINRFEDIPPELSYPLAGSFVRYLAREYGMARVAEFFRRCNGSDATRAAAFEENFGASLTEAATAWGRRI